MDRKAQVHQIGAEDFGVVEWDVEGCKEVEGQGILVGVVEDQVEEEEEEVAAPILIHWLVIGVGCVAIWPVTVPPPTASRWEVAQAALPVERFPNPGTKAHIVAEEEVGKSGSLASMSCMTMRVTLTPSMSQGNCMCHWTSETLLPSQLRWKSEKKQKTKKILRSCGR